MKVRRREPRFFLKGMIELQLAVTIVQLISCVAIVVIVLFQSGKSAGLSGAIGGGSDSYLLKNKSKSLDSKLAKATKWIAAVFVILTLVLNFEFHA